MAIKIAVMAGIGQQAFPGCCTPWMTLLDANIWSMVIVYQSHPMEAPWQAF